MGSFQAPLVSEKFRDALSPLVNGCAEFLPLMKLRKENFYVLNVVKLVDCLDLQRSDILYASDEPGKILHIRKYVFDQGRLEEAPLFKVPEDVGNIFVSGRLLRLACEYKLSGIGVDDPHDIRLAKNKSPVAGFPT
jgi:hypothetical protein